MGNGSIGKLSFQLSANAQGLSGDLNAAKSSIGGFARDAANKVQPVQGLFARITSGFKSAQKTGSDSGLNDTLGILKGGGIAAVAIEATKAVTGLVNAFAEVNAGTKSWNTALDELYQKIPVISTGWALGEALDRAMHADKYRSGQTIIDAVEHMKKDAEAAKAGLPAAAETVAAAIRAADDFGLEGLAAKRRAALREYNVADKASSDLIQKALDVDALNGFGTSAAGRQYFDLAGKTLEAAQEKLNKATTQINKEGISTINGIFSAVANGFDAAKGKIEATAESVKKLYDAGNDTIRGLQAEIENFSASDVSRAVDDAIRKGYSDEQIQTVRRLKNEYEKLTVAKEHADALDQSAARILEDQLTPLDRYKQKIEEIRAAEGTGRINAQQSLLAQDKARREMLGAAIGGMQFQAPKLLQVGSGEALSTLNEIMNHGNPFNIEPQRLILDETKKQTVILTKIAGKEISQPIAEYTGRF